MPIINSLNFPVFKGDLTEIKYKEQKHFVINTISPNSYGLAVKNPVVKQALQNSDMLILDGLYFGWLALFKQGIKINRIAGWDAFHFFSSELNKDRGRVFFLGSSTDTLLKIKEHYSQEYPNVSVAYYSPPFTPKFSEEDNKRMHNAINDFKPDVVFIGMTAPKQEVWAYQNRNLLETKIICSIGNVFDWYAGNSKRPAVFWQKTGMEWLARIFLRPEIFKRNIGNQMLFFWHLFLILINIKKL
ncbi:MAG: WecB/TagA/CpsF family glycosyltransferase [Bacteroidales bacterium]|jgi:N-acetylglucosaminyldiphosphoundecaprenol N-acetyl-beta-D-mannosaminyltransferase|nr:WecB/TagA/CpsF family glycosyltransferase [Bacteroidales bacterium]